ncbi:hypothetical protein B0J13DRAFT_158085 [Dactylonectria estremocensis]|uniref:Uncharacterized protein n=1 Tax=Dactylonectria estremocensis TaxID=1079267 RepID=A0A9P9DM06_9HYPO|nr:hypothetical protein B0J13DRAFT_158085 [Dactylonectria estremocensis]
MRFLFVGSLSLLVILSLVSPDISAPSLPLALSPPPSLYPSCPRPDPFPSIRPSSFHPYAFAPKQTKGRKPPNRQPHQTPLTNNPVHTYTGQPASLLQNKHHVPQTLCLTLAGSHSCPPSSLRGGTRQRQRSLVEPKAVEPDCDMTGLICEMTASPMRWLALCEAAKSVGPYEPAASSIGRPCRFYAAPRRAVNSASFFHSRQPRSALYESLVSASAPRAAVRHQHQRRVMPHLSVQVHATASTSLCDHQYKSMRGSPRSQMPNMSTVSLPRQPSWLVAP